MEGILHLDIFNESHQLIMARQVRLERCLQF